MTHITGIPSYENICATGDRSWSLQLVDRLIAPATTIQESDNIGEVLQAVSDPRTWLSLYEILETRSINEDIRWQAGLILREMRWGTPDIEQEKLLRWWHEGDKILQEHALHCMPLDLPEIVAQVAGDASHPLQSTALLAMDFFFEQPRYQELKIKALEHPDPQIREYAAFVLLWDEPIHAQEPLLRATHDSALTVVNEAMNTLQYYHSQRVFIRLQELLSHPQEDVSGQASISYDSLRNSFGLALTHKSVVVRKHIRRWLQPIWEMLNFSEDELKLDGSEDSPVADNSAPANQKITIKVPLDELISTLSNPDESTTIIEGMFSGIDWKAYNPSERKKLTAFLIGHSDILVRYRAAECFRTWNAQDSLIKLLKDPSFIVRKNVMYEMGQASPPSINIAHTAWEHFKRPATRFTHSHETLYTYVSHAPVDEVIRNLVTLAGDAHQMESDRTAAIEHLCKLEAHDEIELLSVLLEDEPEVTWALHISLLESMTTLKINRGNIKRFIHVDNLEMQEAIASFVYEDSDYSGRI